jgi:hypothetical protein
VSSQWRSEAQDRWSEIASRSRILCVFRSEKDEAIVPALGESRRYHSKSLVVHYEVDQCKPTCGFGVGPELRNTSGMNKFASRGKKQPSLLFLA